MHYIRESDGAYPFDPETLRGLNPDTSFPATLSPALLAEYGVVQVGEIAPPATAETEMARELAPVKTAGVWRQAWAVEALSAPAVTAKLAERKADMVARLKDRRDIAIDAGCMVSGIGRFDSDDAARANLTGAVTGAIVSQGAAQPFAVGWKLADNTVVSLTGAQIINAGMAVLSRVSACHARAQTLGAQIKGAADFAALAAIDLDGGWPI